MTRHVVFVLSGLLAGLSGLLAGAALAGPPTQYGYRVLEQRPLPRDNFVQGLEFDGDTLLVGTGRYGQCAALLAKSGAYPVAGHGRADAPEDGEDLTTTGDDLTTTHKDLTTTHQT